MVNKLIILSVSPNILLLNSPTLCSSNETAGKSITFENKSDCNLLNMDFSTLLCSQFITESIATSKKNNPN